MVTIATAVNKKAWDEIVVGEIAEELGGPIDACFFKCIESTINIIRLRKPGEQINFFFDQATKADAMRIAGLYAIQAKRFPELSGFTFAPVEQVVALQGADMIATQTYWYAQECVKNPGNPVANAHFREFIERDLSVGLFLDREHIEEVAQRVRERQSDQPPPS